MPVDRRKRLKMSAQPISRRSKPSGIHEYTATVAAADPAGAAIEVRSDVEVRRPDGDAFVKTTSKLTPRAVSIHVEIEQAGEVTFRRAWNGERTQGPSSPDAAIV
jgi:hypothetical protein